MVFLKDLFSKSPASSGHSGPSDVPTEKVIMLKDQGLSVNQIYEALQSQAALKEGVLRRGEKMEEYPRAPPMGPPNQRQESRDMYPQDMPPRQMPMDMPQMQTSSGVSEEKIHEIAEAIIEEKWTELIDNVNRIIDWKDNTESKINKLQQQVEDLNHSFDKLHEGVLGKISEYDRGIIDISVEIKALEKVFQKILPGFMENVNELSRITAKMKSVKK
ncbi:MAG: hypothetical protein NT001_03405 [Candidatus Woesearchaeota archaeon]|nr:hypothetical protein [Candidatus Woesearchaeota archaeon]